MNKLSEMNQRINKNSKLHTSSRSILLSLAGKVEDEYLKKHKIFVQKALASMQTGGLRSLSYLDLSRVSVNVPARIGELLHQYFCPFRGSLNPLFNRPAGR